MRSVLVVSPVHPPDDPRIRFKLIPTLSQSWDVTFASAHPGPTVIEGFEYLPLRGGRVRRSLRATRLVLGRRHDAVSIHDPELLPAAIVASRLGRTIVFDLHENFPAQLSTRAGWPRLLRRPAAALARRLLRAVERRAAVTVAEKGYLSLFAGEPTVIPNYPAGITVPPGPIGDAAGFAYLGDVTEARGLPLAVEALGASGTQLPLDVIGRCPPALSAELRAIAARHGVELRLHGYLPLAEALPMVAASVAGLSPLLDLPNYRHSMPTKVLEYLAVGVPVIASRLPGTAAVIEGRPGVTLVEPGRVRPLARAMAAVAADEEARDAAARGAAEVRSEFRWPSRLVARVYEQAIAGGHQGAG